MGKGRREEEEEGEEKMDGRERRGEVKTRSHAC